MAHCRSRCNCAKSHVLPDGYAFSQEEGGSVSQSDVIRVYDTNAPKPSGN